ncbi:MAG: histidine phosphatase family protein [Patescibacteria group bacterium]
MSIHITYFVHGTTTDNQQHISSGWKDVELSELGVKQSIDLKEQIRDKKFDVIFCSDLRRAVDSAKLTFEGVAPIIPDERLRECNYGMLNGTSSDIVEPMQEEECIEKPFPEGESYEDVKARVTDFIDFLKKNYDRKHIGIVAHKAPQLSLDVLLKRKTWKEALHDDWRKTKSWKPGWEYIVQL